MIKFHFIIKVRKEIIFLKNNKNRFYLLYEYKNKFNIFIIILKFKFRCLYTILKNILFIFCINTKYKLKFIF